MIHPTKAAAVLLTSIALGGCWNGDNDSINLGNVSIGQQMIDLKKALDSGAVTQEEYGRLKQTLLSLDTVCEKTNNEQ